MGARRGPGPTQGSGRGIGEGYRRGTDSHAQAEAGPVCRFLPRTHVEKQGGV